MKRLQQTRYALGSDAVLTLVLADDESADELFDQLWAEVRLFEATFSRFQPDSELSHVNHEAGAPTEVSPEFIALAQAARRLASATGGLYNPFVLPHLQAAGYKGSWPKPDEFDPGLDYSKRQIVPASELEIAKHSVQIPAGSALDFGGIGKGYLLDQLASLLKNQSIADYWLSLGGDILCSGHDVDGRSWHVGIQAAHGPQAVASITNQGKPLAIATSGTTKRRGEQAGKSWHHLIDPRTGQPAQTDILTATVATRSATEADVFAKCLVHVGSEAAKTFATRHKLNAWVLQINDTGGKVVVQKTGKVFA